MSTLSTCPVCRKPMVAFELEGVEIDRCVECGGTWLDAGELEIIAETAGAVRGALFEVMQNAKGQRHGRRRCPRCFRKLRVITMGTGKTVEIDRCPEGDGLWFDRGEMEAFIKSFDEGEEGAVARFFADFYGKRQPARNFDSGSKTEEE